MASSSHLMTDQDDPQSVNPWVAPSSGGGGDQPTTTTSSFSDAPKLRAALALADQLVVSGSNFITMALVANNCTPAQVGIFHLAWTLVNFIRTANERTLAAPFMAFVHRPEQNAKTLLGSSLVHQAGFAVACCLFLLVFGFVSLSIPPLLGLGPIVFLLIFALPFMLLRDHIRAVCSAHLQFHVSLAVDFVASLLQVGGILALAYGGLLTIPRVVIVLGVACLLPALGWIVVRPLKFQIDRTSIGEHWSQNWGYAKWLVLSRSIAIGGNNLIPFLVAFMMGQASAGGFGVCSALVGLSLTFIMGANNFFLPRTVKAYHEHGLERMLATIYQTITIIAIVLVSVTLVFAFAGGRLLGTIYGPAYAMYGPIITVLSLGYLAISPSIACGNGLAALGKSKEYLVGEVTYCVIAVLLSVVLIPPFGLLGAAVALWIASCASSAVTGYILWKLVRKARAELSIQSSEPMPES